jgi:hypothetical protein
VKREEKRKRNGENGLEKWSDDLFLVGVSKLNVSNWKIVIFSNLILYWKAIPLENYVSFRGYNFVPYLFGEEENDLLILRRDFHMK